ncbi:RNA polymerase sigma factor [Aquimarina rhabdastrellae]
MNQPSDTYYINEVLDGNVNAFSVLVNRYKSFVFTIVYRLVKNRDEAEEVAQDTFIKAYQSLKSYRGDAKFSTWLYTIAYRKSLDQIKKNKVHYTYTLIEEVNEGDAQEIENGLSYLEQKERTQIIKEGILKLPPEAAAIITFYYFEDKKVKEIATITGLTVDNVKIKLHRSRKQLYSILKHNVLPEISRKNGRAI